MEAKPNHFPYIDSNRVPAFFQHVGKKIRYNQGEILIYADDQVEDVYFLLSGKAKQYVMSEEGREKILFILQSGDIVGDFSIFEKGETGFYVEAIEDLELLHLTLSDLQEALRKYPEFNLYILSSLSKKARNLVAQLEDTCFKDAETRVCDLLIELAFYEGKMDKDNPKITFRTSQQFISDMLGINRITTVKIIKNLKLMGLLDVRGNQYTINDLSLLQMYSLKDC
ncbi:cAMP-binding protein [Desulfitobacterium dehalogenans ATCC 51507]|uniref:cAMP-binding protein n=1 Tax=Desulfitobacterium dehalogenans (strain ATCC 51507 / DSM 9161 / JW/IU-DC1) TaxID=756499 RepID=I4A3K4_DESDJ|nr:cAMP-binding protein [Desulfitobacterium dehalogenans ATCC 51507]